MYTTLVSRYFKYHKSSVGAYWILNYVIIKPSFNLNNLN